ncbi:hypothetical protein [uncultured Celeribacter sp.]|uniref:hypothetical protein n=1 Tax=uncultured Celeribacter sp. TaxID=1303376 RepID=UPI002AA6CC75|nr:hypothetical protein [uncultured Celeribacter sp.]
MNDQGPNSSFPLHVNNKIAASHLHYLAGAITLFETQRLQRIDKVRIMNRKSSLPHERRWDHREGQPLSFAFPGSDIGIRPVNAELPNLLGQFAPEVRGKAVDGLSFTGLVPAIRTGPIGHSRIRILRIE